MPCDPQACGGAQCDLWMTPHCPQVVRRLSSRFPQVLAQVRDLVEHSFVALHEALHLLNGVHHRRVIATAELVTDSG